MDFIKLTKQVFETHNQIRANPKAYIPELEKMLTYFKGKTMYFPGNKVGLTTNEGPSAIHELIKFLQVQQPLPALVFDDSLQKAAWDHANDIGSKGITGHTGSTGSTMSSRIETYGDWDGTIGESISFGNNDATQIILQLAIDDGVASRGHRNNLFNPKFKVVGIACSNHKGYDYCCVLDYAGGMTVKGASKPGVSGIGGLQGFKAQPGFGTGMMMPQQGLNLGSNPGIAGASGLSGVSSGDQPKSGPVNYKNLAKEVFDIQNKLRTNPTFFIPELQKMLTYFTGNKMKTPGSNVNLITSEGPAAVQDLINFLKVQQPIPALKWEEGLSKASEDHANDIGPKGVLSSTGTNGSTMSSRIEKYGQWDISVAENLSSGNQTATEIVLNLAIDDGVAKRSHRKNIFNQDFTVVGVGCQACSQQGVVCIIDYAGGFTDKSVIDKIKSTIPSDYKQLAKEVFDVQNTMRQNPKFYIPELQKRLTQFKGNTLYVPGKIGLITNEGASGVQTLINFLQTQPPISPLQWDDNLAKAAQDHADDIGPKGMLDHNGSNGSTMESRIEKYGKWQSTIGENLSSGGETGLDVILQLAIDDGQLSRGHRKNIFNTEFKVVGIACQKHTSYRTCAVLDYAGGMVPKGGLQNPSYSNPISGLSNNFKNDVKIDQNQFNIGQPSYQPINKPSDYKTDFSKLNIQQPSSGLQGNQQPKDFKTDFSKFNIGQPTSGLTSNQPLDFKTDLSKFNIGQPIGQTGNQPGQAGTQFQGQPNKFGTNIQQPISQQFSQPQQFGNQFSNPNQFQQPQQNQGFQPSNQFGQLGGKGDDPDKPADCVSTQINTSTKIINGKKTITTTKKYILKDGTSKTIVKTTEE